MCFNHFRTLQLFRSILDSHLNKDPYKSCVRNHLKVAVRVTSQWHWRCIPRCLMTEPINYVCWCPWPSRNHNHLPTCFLWADSFNCLANTDSWDTLKTRLIPGNWQTGFRWAFAKKSRVSKFPWSQVSHGEVWLFIWSCIVTPEFLWEDHVRGPSSCEHLQPSKVMSRDKA